MEKVGLLARDATVYLKNSENEMKDGMANKTEETAETRKEGDPEPGNPNVEALDNSKGEEENQVMKQTSRSRPRSDSSENNCSEILTNKIIPCCRKRKCRSYSKKSTPEETECVCVDPCCCYPTVPPAVLDNLKLKQENKALRNCIERVRKCAVSEACELIKGVMNGCKCSCCEARNKLRRCKSISSIPGRETWLCVPMAGSSGCGGYTPSGWGKLLKKCQEYTADPCTVCDFSGRVAPCVSRRCKCLPKLKPCPPCPHLCPVRALPQSLRPYTPCCPLYFPTPINYPKATCTGTSSGVLYKPCGYSDPCKTSAITAPPYKPKYTPLATSTACFSKGMPQPSASVPAAFPKS